MGLGNLGNLANQGASVLGAASNPMVGRLAAGLASSILGAFTGRQDYQVQFAFRVEIDGIMSAAFRKVGPMSWETGVDTVREGGNNRGMRNLINPAKFGDLTLEKGLTSSNNELFLWMKRVHDASKPFMRSNISIVLMAEDGAEAGRFNLFNAFISKYQLAGLEGKTEDVAIESMTIIFDYFEFNAGSPVEQALGTAMGVASSFL